MMKRSLGIHVFICIALGLAVGFSAKMAVLDGNISCIVVCIVATVADVLNIACGYDKDEKK